MINKLKTYIIVLLLAFVACDMASAQIQIYFQGTVSELNSGEPIPNHEVLIVGADSSVLTATTNDFGFYFKTFEVSTYQSSFTVSTLDCENVVHSELFAEVDSSNVANFSICADTSSCHAGFYYEINPDNQLEVNFFDNSIGNINSWFWEFSDGSSSDEQNPDHQFAAFGPYEVSLTVYDTVGFCVDSITKNVLVQEDSAYCEAAFSYALDTLNNISNVYHFFNQSGGSPDSYFWDFGDGTYSYEENPMHSFNESGTYNVCLTISNSSWCNDMACDSITTLEYYNFGGQVFIGDFTINIEDNDSSNTAVANLYRRIENKWEFMDQMSFWKYGYFWFLDKPAGEYLVRVDLEANSIDYENYAPAYHNQASLWEYAETFLLSNSEQFAVNIDLKELESIPSGIGSISGKLQNNGTCQSGISLNNTLVYLYNSEMKLANYTYSDENGSFEFDNLGNGNYFVKAEFTGKSSGLVSVDLTQNENTITGIQLDFGCDAYIGINEKDFTHDEDLVSVFPNPASEVLTVETNFNEDLSVNLELINLNGKIFFQESYVFQAKNQKFSISVNSLPVGLYILRMTNFSKEISISKKIVIGR